MQSLTKNKPEVILFDSCTCVCVSFNLENVITYIQQYSHNIILIALSEMKSPTKWRTQGPLGNSCRGLGTLGMSSLAKWCTQGYLGWLLLWLFSQNHAVNVILLTVFGCPFLQNDAFEVNLLFMLNGISYKMHALSSFCQGQKLMSGILGSYKMKGTCVFCKDLPCPWVLTSPMPGGRYKMAMVLGPQGPSFL